MSLVYQFTIEGEVYKQDASGHRCHSINHIFLIIHYKDEHKQLRYCMLQSYAREQSLLEFLNASEHNNNSHLMVHNEMMDFLSNLQQFVNAKVVDDDIAAFYKKYFQITTKYKNYNLCREATPTFASDSGRPQDYKIDTRPLLLNIQWLKSNMRSVCINLHTHLSAAQQQDAPQIIEIPQNCDNEIVRNFNILLREPAQQNPSDSITFLLIDPYSGQITSKSIAKSQLPIIEALSPAKPQTHTKYPASKNDMINTFKMLVENANTVADLQNIFDIACVCVNQHQNIRWDTFWGINNTASLREIITVIRTKALTVLFRNAPSEENNLDDRMLYFIDNNKLSLFNKHKNNFMITGAYGRTHASKVINEEIDRLRAIHKASHPEL